MLKWARQSPLCSMCPAFGFGCAATCNQNYYYYPLTLWKQCTHFTCGANWSIRHIFAFHEMYKRNRNVPIDARMRNFGLGYADSQSRNTRMAHSQISLLSKWDLPRLIFLLFDFSSNHKSHGNGKVAPRDAPKQNSHQIELRSIFCERTPNRKGQPK